MPNMRNNIYVTGNADTAYFGRIGGLNFDGSEAVEKRVDYNEEFERNFNEVLCEKDSVVVVEK
jgi:hypothetical protein